MICELALDPALVARWHDPKEWAFFREALAPDTGRVGSAFPRKWRRSVVRAFHEAVPSAGEDSQARRRLDTLLDTLAMGMVEREASHPDCATWLAKAEAEHRERPFSGILSLTASPSVPEVMTPDMLFSDRPPSAWKAPASPAPPRTPAELAQAVAPLLARSRSVTFVDPYFDPSKPRFVETLEAMLATLWGPDRCVGMCVTELVTAEGEGRKARDGHWLLGRCEELLPKMVPAGRELQVTVLKQRPGGEKIHNRYILTNLAGVSFGIGLDAADPNEPGQTDDLCRLSCEQLKKRWGQYVSARGSYFDIAAGPVTIVSGRNKGPAHGNRV